VINSGQKVDFPHASFSRRPQMRVGLSAISFDREVEAKAGSTANPLVQPQEGGIPSGDPDPCTIESTEPNIPAL